MPLKATLLPSSKKLKRDSLPPIGMTMATLLWCPLTINAVILILLRSIQTKPSCYFSCCRTVVSSHHDQSTREQCKARDGSSFSYESEKYYSTIGATETLAPLSLLLLAHHWTWKFIDQYVCQRSVL